MLEFYQIPKTHEMKLLYLASGFSMILLMMTVSCTHMPAATSNPLEPTPVLGPTLAAMSDFQKGVVYTSWRHNEYSSIDSNVTLLQLIKPLGVNWLSVVVTCYQDSIVSTEIRCSPDSKTPTDADLIHVIQFAHNLGLRVMLKPHIDISDDSLHWRGQIDFGDDEQSWKAWFGSYTDFITHYADLAQALNADFFVVGTELVDTSGRADQWRSVIQSIREHYSGPLVYAANWGEVWDISWYDALDAIGVDAYYPLTESDQPTAADLTAAWRPIVARLGELSRKWKRPIIITEIGYRSIDGTNRDSSGATKPMSIDLQEQADCYQAVFNAFKGQSWWHGVFWWNWTVDPAQGGPVDEDYTANNKPAENVLRQNYGVPLREIPTQTP